MYYPSGTEAGEQWLYKSSLLVTVTKLIEVSISPTIYYRPLLNSIVSQGAIYIIGRDRSSPGSREFVSWCMGPRAVYVTFLKSTQQAIINLDDDGLTLWSVALRNTLTLNSVNGAPALFDLIPQAVDLLSTNFDLLGKIINIIESYLVLDAPMVLQVCP